MAKEHVPSQPASGAAREPREAGSLRMFRQLVGAIREHYRHIERRTGAAAAEIRLLAAIAELDGAGIGELAAALSLHKSTVSNLTGQLVARGLATRARSPESQRNAIVRATSRGRALLRRAPRPASGLLQPLLASLSDQELDRVEAALALLVARLPKDSREFGCASLTQPEHAPIIFAGGRAQR